MIVQAQEKLASPGLRSMKLLIVDKESSARSAFTQLCSRSVDLEVVGEAESGDDAIDAATALCPDVMIIDVALPDMSGFEVLRIVGNSRMPLSIMTSNEFSHAERAIAEGAVDYLIKPVSAERFVNAIGRARQRYVLREAAENQLAREVLRVLGRRPKLLVGQKHHRLYPLDIEKIDYIEADGNYVTIRVGEAEYSSRDSIKRLATDLADFGFVRIDRSILLNIRAVHFAEPVGHGTLAFTLSSGACLHSSKTCREAIQRIMPWQHCRAGSDF